MGIWENSFFHFTNNMFTNKKPTNRIRFTYTPINQNDAPDDDDLLDYNIYIHLPPEWMSEAQEPRYSALETVMGLMAMENVG